MSSSISLSNGEGPSELRGIRRRRKRNLPWRFAAQKSLLELYAAAIWSGRREYRHSSLIFETREWSWCGAVISLDRGRNADEARSSQREDAKRIKGDEAGLSNPMVFGVLR
ncbi:hypothetical protein ACFX2B_014383 [Malus domestica]